MLFPSEHMAEIVEHHPEQDESKQCCWCEDAREEQHVPGVEVAHWVCGSFKKDEGRAEYLSGYLVEETFPACYTKDA